MPVITIDLKDKADIEAGLAILGQYIEGGMPELPKGQTADTPSDDMLDMGGLEAEDSAVDEGGDLDDLLGMEEEPGAPTVDDMKQKIAGAIKAKGKDEVTALLQKVYKKLGVKNLSGIPEDKRESFLTVMGKFVGKDVPF